MDVQKGLCKNKGVCVCVGLCSSMCMRFPEEVVKGGRGFYKYLQEVEKRKDFF